MGPQKTFFLNPQGLITGSINPDFFNAAWLAARRDVSRVAAGTRRTTTEDVARTAPPPRTTSSTWTLITPTLRASSRTWCVLPPFCHDLGLTRVLAGEVLLQLQDGRVLRPQPFELGQAAAVLGLLRRRSRRHLGPLPLGLLPDPGQLHPEATDVLLLHRVQPRPGLQANEAGEGSVLLAHLVQVRAPILDVAFDVAALC